MNINCSGSDALSNPTKACKDFDISRIRRHFLTRRTDANGTKKSIAYTDAVAIANWQTLFDTYNFDTDPTDKVVPLVKNYNFVQTNENEIVFSEDTYKKTIFKGDETIVMQFNSISPEYVAVLDGYSDIDLAAYLSDENGSMFGWSQDGVNVYPFSIEDWKVGNFNFPGETISIEAASYQFADTNELKYIVKVEVLDTDSVKVNMSQKLGDVIYSLQDAVIVVSSPALTGCVFTFKTVEPITADAIDITGVAYGDITFVDQADDTQVTLASADKLTYNSATGEYTVNEAALLTTGHTYDLEIRDSPWDAPVQDVAAP